MITHTPYLCPHSPSHPLALALALVLSHPPSPLSPPRTRRTPNYRNLRSFDFVLCFLYKFLVVAITATTATTATTANDLFFFLTMGGGFLLMDYSRCNLDEAGPKRRTPEPRARPSAECDTRALSVDISSSELGYGLLSRFCFFTFYVLRFVFCVFVLCVFVLCALCLCLCCYIRTRVWNCK